MHLASLAARGLPTDAVAEHHPWRGEWRYFFRRAGRIGKADSTAVSPARQVVWRDAGPGWYDLLARPGLDPGALAERVLTEDNISLASAPNRCIPELARRSVGQPPGGSMDARYYTLSISLYSVADIYQVELSHSDPDSQARVAPIRAAATLDLGALRALELVHEQYGKALALQVFAASEVAQRLVQVETAAQSSDSFLRILVCIDPSAQELQGLRWELLRHPQSGAALATSERVLLSRFMVSRDWRPVRLRARGELTALIAVSAPAADKLQRLEIEGLEQPPEPRVTLYEGRFYEGASQSFGVGSHDVHTFKRIGDNRVSSVKVDAGLRVTLYEDIGFKGNTLPLAADTTHLEYFEDLCSGIKVERVRPNEALKVNAMQAAIQASPAPLDEAVFYESADFTGRATSYGVGKHTKLGLGDDQISSVKVPSGMKVTLYENADFTGRKEVLRYDTQSLPRFNDMCSAIEVQQITAAERVPLNFGNTGIYFDLDKATIKPKSRPTLDRLVAVLKEFTFIRIEIIGHTASTGSRAYNMEISGRRAQSVKRYLVEHGIDENRIETRGAGPDEPVADNDTPAGRAKNNRIEMQRIDD